MWKAQCGWRTARPIKVAGSMASRRNGSGRLMDRCVDKWRRSVNFFSRARHRFNNIHHIQEQQQHNNNNDDDDDDDGDDDDENRASAVPIAAESESDRWQDNVVGTPLTLHLKREKKQTNKKITARHFCALHFPPPLTPSHPFPMKATVQNR